jgi:hypothetical protein
MKAVAVVAGIIPVLLGAAVLAIRLEVIPADLLVSVRGTSDVLPSDWAIYAGAEGVIVGLVVMVVGSIGGRPRKADKFARPAANTSASSVAKAQGPAPQPRGLALGLMDVQEELQPAVPAYVVRSFSDTATWEHDTGTYEFSDVRVSSSEMFGIPLARRTPLDGAGSFEVRARMTVTKDAPDPANNTLYVGVAAVDETAVHIGHCYAGDEGVQTAAQDSATYERTFEASPLLEVQRFGAAVAISPAILLNYGASRGLLGGGSKLRPL